MGEADNCSMMKRTLQSLCVCNGWSYGVFWGFDHRNPMLLAVEDAYYEDQVGALLDNMLLKVHLLGEGTISQAALSGKYQWILEDGQNSFRSSENRDIFQVDSEVSFQFSSGIKTIAVIPIEPRGVVQFGSTEKIIEKFEFVDQTIRLFREIENLAGFNSLENVHSPDKGEMYDINGLFASLVSNNGVIPLSGFDCKGMQGNNCSAMNSSQSSPSTSDIRSGRTEFSNMIFEQAFLQSTCSVKNASADKASCISTRSGEYPSLASYNRNLASETRLQDSADVILLNGNSLASLGNAEQDSETEIRHLQIQASSGNLMDNQQSLPSVFAVQSGASEQANSLDRSPDELLEEFRSADFTTDLFNFCQGDDFSQWFASSPDQSISQMVNVPSGELTQLVESTSISSCLVGGDMAIDQHPAKKDMSDSRKLNVGSGQTGESWEDILMPLMAGNSYPTTSSASGKCVSGSNATTSMSGPKKGLFSELGLEELLVGASSSSCLTKSSLEDQSSHAKRRRVESSSGNSNQSQKSLLGYSLEKASNLVTRKELPKSQVGLWIDDSYSLTAASAVLSQTQKPEEQKKVTRKRARPGESTRPRPKDRQLIQDRIKELRGIIPNGSKCSIDSLLDRTIKYMVFLQGVTKHADKLKQSNEPKLIGNENGVVLRDNSISGGGGGGATWAFEVGGQSMVCPIIVEDLSPPGQMLIEMLCEEQGFFLEIADIIRGFGLIVLKGSMEIRENKIWAHFIVEAKSHVTRIDIFWSLVRLLQETSTNGMDSTNQPNNVVLDGGIPLLDSYQKPNLPPPICLTETLH